MKNIIDIYKKFWTNYVNFGGKATVPEFWWTFLVNVVINTGFFVLGLIPGIAFIAYIFSLAVLIPDLAIMVRRLNDAGHRWTNVFWLLLPIVGWIILVIRLTKPSIAPVETTENK
ncbi:MAG: DUF805 domain-containing protein, partial [Clostridia bacterium]